MKKGLVTLFAVTGLLLSFTFQVRGDATVFWDSDDGFSPKTVVIGPSETVTWWNYDPYGFDVRVTFENSFSFLLRDYYGQGVIFPATPGYYQYHSDWGDNGAVIINIPPSVAVTNPLNNAVFPAPATFTIQATASDTVDDYVSDVQFFLGTSDSTNSIEDVYSAPFSTTVADLAAGSYVLIAVATDSRGAQTTNAIAITVGGGESINLGAPRFSGGQFLFDVTGLTLGKTTLLQVTTNLMSWQSVRTNIAESTAMIITNTSLSGSHYFRILQQP